MLQKSAAALKDNSLWVYNEQPISQYAFDYFKAFSLHCLPMW